MDELAALIFLLFLKQYHSVHEKCGLGAAHANKLNLEANEHFFRKYTVMLLKSGQISKPQNIEGLVAIFRKIWATCFFEEVYIHEPITVQGNEATWIGQKCNVFA